MVEQMWRSTSGGRVTGLSDELFGGHSTIQSGSSTISTSMLRILHEPRDRLQCDAWHAKLSCQRVYCSPKVANECIKPPRDATEDITLCIYSRVTSESIVSHRCQTSPAHLTRTTDTPTTGTRTTNTPTTANRTSDTSTTATRTTPTPTTANRTSATPTPATRTIATPTRTTTIGTRTIATPTTATRTSSTPTTATRTIDFPTTVATRTISTHTMTIATPITAIRTIATPITAIRTIATQLLLLLSLVLQPLSPTPSFHARLDCRTNTQSHILNLGVPSRPSLQTLLETLSYDLLLKNFSSKPLTQDFTQDSTLDTSSLTPNPHDLPPKTSILKIFRSSVPSATTVSVKDVKKFHDQDMMTSSYAWGS
ncbi:cell wall protein DAN4-like [Homarus americanus]|uniref:cell wall protein DAN4-like n=1 Tax=Homarus americanus TaxID=6706 RepID=UPI001C495337|nr:cell wall protein DAN4-like [Homarus americanus]